MAAASPYGRGFLTSEEIELEGYIFVVGLLKRGWNEIPGVMGSTVMSLIGLGLGTVGIIRYEQNEKFAPTYKKSYTVYRPDDPRVNRPTHDWI